MFSVKPCENLHIILKLGRQLDNMFVEMCLENPDLKFGDFARS